MANPQPEQFTKVSNELMEIIPCFKFNGTQLRILLVVIRYTYGFNRKQHQLSLSFLAESTGIHKQQIKREIDNLINSNVLIEVAKPSFNTARIIGLNKDYEQWEIETSKPLKNESFNEVDSKLEKLESAKKVTVNEKDDSQSAKKVTPTVSVLAYQERKDLKDNLKERYICEIEKIWAHYTQTFDGLFPRGLTLTKERKNKILARLRSGQSVDLIKTAITNIRKSEFHCGVNDKGKIYATPEFICRNDSKVEEWANYDPKLATSSSNVKSNHVFDENYEYSERAEPAKGFFSFLDSG